MSALLDSELNRTLGALVQAADPGSPPAGPLSGWTIAVKDNTDVAGTVRSDGLRGPWRRPATADAEVVRRLRAAGASIVAKANLEELSFAATTQNPYWGACRNPWDPERIPGGSSGGSAVAVAAGLTTAAIGTDTGGSLRNPASFCGVTTIRPTHGLVPTAGVTPLSPSLDVVGPLARSALEVRALLDVMAGGPPLPRTVSSLRGLRVGIPTSWFLDDLDDATAAGLDSMIELLRGQGAELSAVDTGDVEAAHRAMAVLQNSEAVRQLHGFWDDPRVSDGIRERMRVGRDVTPDEVDAACDVRDAWRARVDDFWTTQDVLLMPATPFVAPPIAGGDLTRISREINRLTGCWSLTGLPVVVLPTEAANLPVGVQLVGPAGGDGDLLAAAELVQAVTGWHRRIPSLYAG
ncbi:MAG: amidase [Nocardioides sp.]